nr:MAG: hypothetical protein [Tombusviridae sp.]
MGIDILSQASTFETAKDQDLVSIDEWLKESGALKERTTERGQIVTALKMVWWVLCAPFHYSVLVVKKLFLCIFLSFSRAISRALSMVRYVRDWVVDTLTLAKIVANRRVKALSLLMLCLLVTMIGPLGVLAWFGLLVMYVMCFIPTDARYYVRFFENLQRVWTETLDDDDIVAPEAQTILAVDKKKRTGFACKLAVRAISKVGLLSATKANALVYQKVVLDEMKTLNVRYSDRVRILPLAIAACLDRPEEVRKVEECIKHYTSTSTAL